MLDPNTSRWRRDDPINYGAMPVIGKTGNIYLPTGKHLHIIKNNVTPQALQGTIGALLDGGVLTAGQANSLLASLNSATAAKTLQAQQNQYDTLINKIEAMVFSNRLSISEANNLIDMITQLKNTTP